MSALVLANPSVGNDTAENSNIDGNPDISNVKADKHSTKVFPKSQPVRFKEEYDATSRIPGTSVKVRNNTGSSAGNPKYTPRYLRPSGSSCHDACKYGTKSSTETSDIPKHSSSRPLVSTKSSPPRVRVPNSIAKTNPPVKIVSSPSKSPLPNAGKATQLVGSSGFSDGSARCSKLPPNPRALSSSMDSGIRALKSAPKYKASSSANSTEKKKMRASISPKKRTSMSPKPRLPTSSTKPHSFSPKANEFGRGNAKPHTPSSNSLGSGSGGSKHMVARNKKAPLNSKANLSLKGHKIDAPNNQLEMPSDTFSHAPNESKTENQVVELPDVDLTKPHGKETSESARRIADRSGKRSHIHPNDILGNNSLFEQPATASTGQSTHPDLNSPENNADIRQDANFSKEISDENNLIPYCPPQEIDDFDYDGDGFGYNGNAQAEALVSAYNDQDSDSLYSEYTDETEDYQSDTEEENSGMSREHKRAGEEHSRIGNKLRFRRGQELSIHKDNQVMERKKFRRRRNALEASDSPESENVKLRHQDVQGRKTAEEFMLNHVIEETVQKLAPTKKSKVKALVGAFESVISLKEKETETK